MKYFSTLLLLCGSMTCAAVDTNNLVAPTVPGVDVSTLSSATTIYLYNVEADAFVTYGMNWNTNAIATRLCNGDYQTSARHECHVLPQSDGTYQLQSNGNTDKFIGTNGGNNDVWIDFSTNNSWTIEKREDDTYSILYGNDPLDVSYPHGGHLTTQQGKGKTAWVFMAPEQITNGEYALYKAKRQFYDFYQTLLNGGAATSNYFMTAAATSYNDPEATVASLQAATKTLLKRLTYCVRSTTDATFAIANADMQGSQSLEEWGNASFTFRDGDIELYHQPFTLSQTITALPEGMYTVILHGLTRRDGEAPTPTLSAEGSIKLETGMRNMLVTDWGCNDGGGNGWKKAGNTVIPNNMLAAGQALTSGYATANLQYVPVEGELTITLDETSSTNWNNIQRFELQYTRPTDFLSAKESAIDKCIKQYNSTAAPGIIKALNTKKTVIREGGYTALEAYNMALAIDSLTENAPATINPYAKLSKLHYQLRDFNGYYPDFLSKSMMSAYNAMESATTAKELNDAYDRLYADYLEAVRLQTTNGYDMTVLLTNPTINITSTQLPPAGWTGNTSSWRWTQGTGDSVMECWNENAADVNFDMHQTIHGLQEGIYEISCQMFNSSNDKEASAFCGNECGLYAKTATGHAYIGVAEDSEQLTTYTLLITVREGEDLTLGVKNVNRATARWFACDNFKLKYRTLEKAAPTLLATVPNDIRANASCKEAMQVAELALDSETTLDNFEQLHTAIADVWESATAYSHIWKELEALSVDNRLQQLSEEQLIALQELQNSPCNDYAEESITGNGEEEVKQLRTCLAQSLINTGGNLTPLIINNGFETGDTEGWSVIASSDTGARSTSDDVYEAIGSKGEWLFNTWWKGNPCTQNIGYLPAGTYKLSAMLTSEGGHIYLMVNDMHNAGLTCPDKKVMTRSNCIFTLDAPTNVTIGVVGGNDQGGWTSDGYYWYKADDFQLTTVSDEELASMQMNIEGYKDNYYARGSEDVFGRFSYQGGDFVVLEEGLLYSATEAEPTINKCDGVSQETLSYCGTIHKISGLQPATAYWVRPYVKVSENQAFYGISTKVYTLPRGGITYNIRTSGNTECDSNVTNAISTMTDYWNRYTNIQGYHVNAGYVDGVPTAECSYGGYMSFGSNTSYQQCGTAMHESMHGIGGGTSNNWSTLCNGKNWIGPRVNEFVQFWENNEAATFYGDKQHGWVANGTGGLSYTINGAHEDNYSDLQRTANSLLAQAFGEDGLRATNNSWLFSPYYSFEQDDHDLYYIVNKETGTYLTDNGGTLATRSSRSTEAQWFVVFDATSQTYHIKSKAGNNLSHENYIWGLNKEDSRIVMPQSTARDSYWLTTPTTDGRCLAADLSCPNTDLTGATPANEWVLTRAVHVTLTELTQIIAHMNGGDASIPVPYDIDANGELNTEDVNTLLQLLLTK